MRLNRYTLSLLLLSMALGSCDYDEPFVQTSTEKYQKFIGGAFKESAIKSIVLEDGNVLTLGNKSTRNLSNFYLVKTDVGGNVIWEKEYGGNLNDEARDMQITANENILILGFMTAANSDTDFILLETDAQGELIDSLAIGNPNRKEEGNQILQLSDGSGYVLGGSVRQGNQIIENTFYKILLQGGGILWETIYGNLLQPGEVVGMAELPDGQVIWVGNSNIGSGTDSNIISSLIDENGIDNSIAYFGQNNDKNEIAYSLFKNGSSWLISGSTYDNESSNNKNAIIVTLSYRGQIDFEPNYEIPSDQNTEIYDLTRAPNGNLLLAGYRETAPEVLDIYLAQWNANTGVSKEKTFGGSNADFANTVIATQNSLFLSGTSTVATNESIMLMKTDLEGNLND